MFIKVKNSSIPTFWLPLIFYDEPYWGQVLVTLVEICLYIFTGYVKTVALKTILEIRIFHTNLMIIGGSAFGMWYFLIFGKLITIAYRLIPIIDDIGRKGDFWTDDPEKMLNVQELDGIWFLIVAGFLECYFGYSVVFGIMGVVTERVIASLLIDNYEKNTNILIPVAIITMSQFFAISLTVLLISNIFPKLVLTLPWVACFVVSIFMYFYIREINTKWLQEMENPRRTRVFTVSQRFQVKENLKAVYLSERIVASVLGSLLLFGSGLLALSFNLLSPFTVHIGENMMFCYPLLIMPLIVFGIPAWKKRFVKYFPEISFFRQKMVIRMSSVDVIDDNQKQIMKETDTYFRQLKDAWI